MLLIAAFSARTDLLVLDEPTSGLDPLMESLFQRCVHEAVAQGRTVLLSSHILHEVEQLCGAVTIIKDGRLVESGQVAQMRHLATSSITATVTSDRIGEVRAALGRLAVPGSVSDAGSVDIRVAGAQAWWKPRVRVTCRVGSSGRSSPKETPARPISDSSARSSPSSS